MLRLELELLLLGLSHLLLHDFNLTLELPIAAFFLVEVLFDVGACSYSFHGQLHGLALILLQVINSLLELVHLIHGNLSVCFSLFLGIKGSSTHQGLRSEKLRQKLGVE